MPISASALRDKVAILRDAYRAELGRDASSYELQAAAAMCWYESAFGTGWGKMGSGCAESRNWGAIQSRTPTCCYTTDHLQDGTAYQSYFACYPDDLAAARDVVAWYRRHPAVLQALARGDLGAFSLALYQSGYYGGICKGYRPGSPECTALVVRNHALGLHRLAREVAAAMGEPVIPIGTVPDAPAAPSGGGSSGTGIAAFALVGVGALAILALTLRKR